MKNQTKFIFDVEVGDDIIVHAGYNDFEGTFSQRKDETIVLIPETRKKEKDILEIDIAKIVAITKRFKK